MRYLPFVESRYIEHMPKISVIVPVYNVEPYLRQCVDSILNQTFTDFELLLVDDGSTDCSGAICDEYANRDFRVKVFYTVNRGVSAARNLGIDKASAEWVTFVDSDDFVESDYLESLDKGESCELSFVGISRYNIDNKSRQVLVKFHSEFIFREQLGKKVVELDLLAVGYACGKLYKKEIIDSNHIRFDERVRIHEDHLFYYDYLFVFKNKVYTPLFQQAANFIKVACFCMHIYRLRFGSLFFCIVILSGAQRNRRISQLA